MATSYGGVEVATEVNSMKTFITELENLQAEMQACVSDLASLQQNISNDSNWVGNGKEECSSVLLLLAKYSACLSGMELGISGNVCDNVSLNSKNVTGEYDHYKKLVDAFDKYKDGAVTFTDKTAQCIVELNKIQ